MLMMRQGVLRYRRTRLPWRNNEVVRGVKARIETQQDCRKERNWGGRESVCALPEVLQERLSKPPNYQPY